MRILQATAWYPPHHLGGTEVYVTGLVRELRSHGITSRIASPLAPAADDGYEYDGAVVRTYPVNNEGSRSEFRGHKPHAGFSRFCEILCEERPDVYHQHSWTRGLGAQHLLAAHKLGLKTVLTVHTPNLMCLRGTMMRFGETACDGGIGISKCAECWCRAKDISPPVSRVLANVPSPLGDFLELVGLGNRVTTALSARRIVTEKRRELTVVIGAADRIVVVCQWLHDALSRNGVPQEKLVLSRQGVDGELAYALHMRDSVKRSDVFRLVFIGRWHPVKGIDILVKAVRAVPAEVPLELIIYGVGLGQEECDYETRIRIIAADDPRIHIAPAVPHEKIPEILWDADALAVPSVWLETGPLTVLEARATGLPVIGSRLGGIAELVREPEDGVLVAPNDVKAWTQSIVQFVRNCKSPRQRGKFRQIRTAYDCAADMAKLYGSIC